MKNFNAVGKIRKNENAIPIKNKITDAGTKIPKIARSPFVNAGKKIAKRGKKSPATLLKIL